MCTVHDRNETENWQHIVHSSPTNTVSYGILRLTLLGVVGSLQPATQLISRHAVLSSATLNVSFQGCSCPFLDVINVGPTASRRPSMLLFVPISIQLIRAALFGNTTFQLRLMFFRHLAPYVITGHMCAFTILVMSSFRIPLRLSFPIVFSSMVAFLALPFLVARVLSWSVFCSGFQKGRVPSEKGILARWTDRQKGTLARWTDRQKGTLARWTDRQKGTLARWTEEKGHN